MKVKIGDKTVVQTATFILADNEVGFFETKIGDWSVKFSFIFRKHKAKGSHVSWTTENDVVKFVFTGWTNCHGTALVKPHKLGKTSKGEELGFAVFHKKSGSINKLDFQLLLGGKYE